MKKLEILLDTYRQWLNHEKEQLNIEIASLQQEDRMDEANWNKIRLNIVGVFEAVASVDAKLVSHQSEDSAEAFCARYLPRFVTLTAPWRAQLENARAHADAPTAAIEEIKLDMAARIEAAFRFLKENR